LTLSQLVWVVIEEQFEFASELGLHPLAYRSDVEGVKGIYCKYWKK
jgi:hypothetical protein